MRRHLLVSRLSRRGLNLVPFLFTRRSCSSTTSHSPLAPQHQPRVESLPDLGEVKSVPLKSVSIIQLHGSWVVKGGPLEGELFVDSDGTCQFRPAEGLGHGFGHVKLRTSAADVAAFVLELEVYLYSQQTREPPLHATRLVLSGIVSKVTTSVQNYSTLTLSGHVHAADKAALGPLNAAKMEPWDSTMRPQHQPDPNISTGFRELFPHPFALADRTKIELERHRVGTVNSVYYVPDFLNESEEASCMAQLRHTPPALRKAMDRRTVQEYGGTMCETCNSSFVADLSQPPWTMSICDSLVQSGVFSAVTFPNNVRIHEYDVGHGIAPHVDGPIYLPRVAIISLQSSVLMNFFPYQKPHEDAMEHYNDTFKFDGETAKRRPLFSLVLEPRSLLVFDGDAYFFHPHGISANSHDSLLEHDVGPIANRHLLRQTPPNATTIERRPRVGVTIRHLLARCQHQPERAEYCMKRFWNIQSRIQPTAAGTGVMQSPPTDKTEQLLVALMERLDAVSAEQREIKEAIRQLQTIAAHSGTQQIQFQTEVCGVLDSLSQVVMDIRASVPPS